jgi:Immunoglobulin domain/Immunoglobulin I-set domain
VTGEGKVLVRFEGVAEIPSNFEAATSSETPPTQLVRQPFEGEAESLVRSGFENESGGALSISPEGRLFESAAIVNEGVPENGFFAIKAGIAEREAANGAMVGWSGGQDEEIESDEECVLEPGFKGREFPIYLAAGSEGKVFALAPEYLLEANEKPPETHGKAAIIEFGKEGKGCPTAKGQAVEVREEGSAPLSPEEPVVALRKVTLSTTVGQADALSETWSIENPVTKEKVEPSPTLEFIKKGEEPLLQQPAVAISFPASGEWHVHAKVGTDDLDTPSVETTERTVKVDGRPVVKLQPASTTVKEGEAATFKAEASGTPTPEVQWEEKAPGGKFKAIAGATSTTYTVEKPTACDSGNEYRAVFTTRIFVEKKETEKFIVPTNAAKLTVTGSSSGEPPEVTTQPQEASVTEGAAASFTAAASGSPAPQVQWEVSSNGGSTFSPVSGATSDTLTIEGTTVSESGNEYRAVFSNGVCNDRLAISAAATLSVGAKPPPSGGGGFTEPPPPSGGVLPEHIVKPVPTAAIASTSLKVTSSGVLTLKVTCPAAETRCLGTVTVRTLTAIATSAGASAAEKKPKKMILTLASGPFSVAGGASESIKLHLSAVARKLLARSHTLRVKAIVRAHDPAGATHKQEQTLTLRLTSPAHKR